MKTITDFSIIGRGIKSGALEISYYNFRDYATDKHQRVDDCPYGGGMGMLLMAEPICNCHTAIMAKITGKKTRTVYMSPKGRLLTQKIAYEYTGYDDIIVLCGHYEGVDQRVLDLIADDEISVGDYVLTGGELPCAIFLDSVARLAEGVLADPECHFDESISTGLLEYPHYTRPYEFKGLKVPDVLLTGHHENINAWRLGESLRITAKNRPDLLIMYESKNGGNIS